MAIYWEYRALINYDGVTKDQFFRRYHVLGASGQYIQADFANLFLKNNDAERKADSLIVL